MKEVRILTATAHGKTTVLGAFASEAAAERERVKHSAENAETYEYEAKDFEVKK